MLFLQRLKKFIYFDIAYKHEELKNKSITKLLEKFVNNMIKEIYL